MEAGEWKYEYEREYKTEWWIHTCGKTINDETMRFLWLKKAKYCPFCRKRCTYDYTKRESENMDESI